jgi:hypothetical protein
MKEEEEIAKINILIARKVRRKCWISKYFVWLCHLLAYILIKCNRKPASKHQPGGSPTGT